MYRYKGHMGLPSESLNVCLFLWVTICILQSGVRAVIPILICIAYLTLMVWSAGSVPKRQADAHHVAPKQFEAPPEKDLHAKNVASGEHQLRISLHPATFDKIQLHGSPIMTICTARMLMQRCLQLLCFPLIVQVWRPSVDPLSLQSPLDQPQADPLLKQKSKPRYMAISSCSAHSMY